MKLSELSCCPFCGCEQFYTHDYMYGSTVFKQRFDGGEPEHNEDMYEGLMVNYGAKAYCEECDKYIGNTKTDKVGVAALKAFKRGEQNAR